MPLIPRSPFKDLEKADISSKARKRQCEAVAPTTEERTVSRRRSKTTDDDFVPLFPALRMKMPALDVSETENEVVVEMEAPGVDPNKIELSMEGNRLYIRTNMKEKNKGAFERTVALPTEVKGDKAEATYKDGVLKVVIPKAETMRPKKIAVKMK